MFASPFPGMDPYLEAPGLWPDVHERLINIMAEQLAPLLAPKYITELNSRIVIDHGWKDYEWPKVVIPDVVISGPETEEDGEAYDDGDTAIARAPVRLHLITGLPLRQAAIFIREQANSELVAVIELLSPVNKRLGRGRSEYMDKRAEYAETKAHLIEIDLLRAEPRLPFVEDVPPCDYLIMVCNAYRRPVCDAWPLTMRDALPVIPVPLSRPDPAVPLDLGEALQTAYSRARYDLRIDYQKPPVPPFRDENDATWAQQQIHQ
jgi:hypothetical protein